MNIASSENAEPSLTPKLTVIPEPSAALMSAMGLLALFGRRRRAMPAYPIQPSSGIDNHIWTVNIPPGENNMLATFAPASTAQWNLLTS